jgi:hypothetical protein
MRCALLIMLAVSVLACSARAQSRITPQSGASSSYSLPTSKRGSDFPKPRALQQNKQARSEPASSTANQAQNSDDDLRIYAVSVINVAPFFPFNMYGVYLGKGAVLTAAHVLGHWPLSADPTIVIDGKELPAKVIKKGSFDRTDLALLFVDEASLPVGLRLRRDPLCKAAPSVGTNVVVAYPDRTARSLVISPKVIPLPYRNRIRTLIRDVQVSGSGAFDAEKKCLLGIMSASATTQDAVNGQKSHAGYFVPASAIADFIPAEFRF